jgi:hypothetical protein
MKQINRIILFGDSWIEGQGVFARTEIDSKGRVKFFQNQMAHNELRKWRRENGWNKFLKKWVDCEIINYATQGSSNYAQFSHMNSILHQFTDTDLILFGFTSKYRDTQNQIMYAYQLGYDLIHSKNPLRNVIAFEKKDLNTKYSFASPEKQFYSKFEEEFTRNHIPEFFTKVFDEAVYENIAQENYLFYQNWFKEKGLNIIFFDLFEQYINPKYVNNWYDVDTSMYITYGKDTMHETLLKYEKETYTKESPYSIWEYADVKFPPNNEIYHPNQYGYEYYVDYLWNRYISKQYKF